MTDIIRRALSENRIFVANPGKVEATVDRLKSDGPDNLHILSDFDRTLTKAYVNGRKVPSLIAALRDGDWMPKSYRDDAHKLFNLYHPIEVDPEIPAVEKKTKMREWWSRHLELLISYGLSLNDIERAAESDWIILRRGAKETFDLCADHGIPFIIISACGIGDAIGIYLAKQGVQKGFLHIVTNRFEWDPGGKASAVKEPIIHILNKNEAELENFPFYGKISSRKNVILLGDSLDDKSMIAGFSHDNLLTIGVSGGDRPEDDLANQENFDIMISNDGELMLVYDLLLEITNNG